MSINPLEDPSATYRVLVNAERQHSLWPAFSDVPAGWRVVVTAGTRDECLGYVRNHSKDMRPTLA